MRLEACDLGSENADVADHLGDRLCTALRSAIYLPDPEAQRWILLPVLLSVTAGRTRQQIEGLDRSCVHDQADLLERTRQALEEMNVPEAAALLEGGGAAFRGKVIGQTAAPLEARFGGDLTPERAVVQPDAYAALAWELVNRRFLPDSQRC